MQTVFILLALTSALTTLTTEAVKNSIPEGSKYSKNILAGVVAIVIGVLVSIGYCVLTHTKPTSEVIVYAVSLVALSWICAMVGYDKVVQTLSQVKNKKEDQ